MPVSPGGRDDQVGPTVPTTHRALRDDWVSDFGRIGPENYYSPLRGCERRGGASDRREAERSPMTTLMDIGVQMPLEVLGSVNDVQRTRANFVASVVR